MWWLGPACIAFIILFFLYRIFFVKMDLSADETTPDDVPLPVPPDRAAMGVQALLRLPRDRHSSGYSEYVRGLVVRPDGNALAGITARGLRFWDPATGVRHPIRQLRPWGSGPPHAFAWSPDAEHFVFANGNYPQGDEIHLYHDASAKLLAHCEPVQESITHLQFSPEGGLICWLASTCFGIWDREKDEVRMVEGGSRHDLRFVRYRGGVPRLLTHCSRGTFEWWDPESMERVDEVGFDTNCWFMGFLAGGRYAFYQYHGVVEIRDTRTGDVTARRRMNGEDVKCAWTDRHLEIVGMGMKNGRVVLWDPNADELLADVKVADEAIYEVAGTEAGQLVTVAGFERSIAEVWSTALMQNAWRARRE